MGKRRNNPNTAEEPENPKGLSQGAWVAIGTIAAAVITGAFALATQLIPKPSPDTTPTPTPVLSTPSPSPTSVPLTADAIAGKWSGTAKDSNGKSFQITLEIRKSCALRQRCGVISVSHVPCEGEVFLENVQGNSFEFHVDNFFGRSDRTVCQAGAGELFRLQADGKLLYSTSYEPKAQGTLTRVDD